LGTNVTEVLNWVGEGSADAGVVYATDAAASKKVEIIAEAPAGSLAAPVIYPVGLVAASAHPDEAKLFIEFLASDEAMAIFKAYGFSPNR
jgi:molybdate transport system substrate-binding protein